MIPGIRKHKTRRSKDQGGVELSYRCANQKALLVSALASVSPSALDRRYKRPVKLSQQPFSQSMLEFFLHLPHDAKG